MLGALAVAAVLLVSQVAAARKTTPYQDIPYEEIVSKRFVWSSSEPIYNWGQLPVDSASQVALGNISSSISGAFVLSTESLIFVGTDSEFTTYAIDLTGVPIEAGSRIALDPTSAELAVIATPQGVYQIGQCSLSGLLLSCIVEDSDQYALGVVNDITVTASNGNSIVAYVAAMNGGFMFASGKSLVQIQDEPPTAVAFFPSKSLLAFGSNSSLMLYINNTLIRRDWATDLEQAVGGVYEAPITSLVFDSYGWLFVGTLACVNILFPNQTVNHLSRFQGLPYNVTTSLSIERNTQNLWVGTTLGAARWNRADSTWRYFYLQRYLPGASIVASVSSTASNFTVIATDGGIAILESQLWTLAEKADWMEAIQTRHSRHGLSAGCGLQSFGNYSSCTNGPDDNNGLWTSIVVVAEVHRYLVTGDQDAFNNITNYFSGMQLLNLLTGITGLMARSIVSPTEPRQSPSNWHNCTVPGYEGWQWEGDTSSDEVTGHMFAYSALAKLDNSTLSEQAATLIRDIVSYIVDNNFYLIDITGNHTEWGIWNPTYLNWNRDWTDERGVNSLQILAWLLSAITNTGDPTNKFGSAYEQLTNITNQYDVNMINCKIETPIDDNYSDDELTFLPYFTFFTNCEDPEKLAFAKLSIERTFNYIRPLRSDLWNAIYAAVGGEGLLQSDIDDIVWNLQTWPLELVDWPTDNSLRQDIFIDPTMNGNMQFNAEALTVLPANERSQGIWNGDPYDLTGGSAYYEYDAGAWLLPYWIARYYQLIA